MPGEILTADQMKSRLDERPDTKVQMILLNDVMYRPTGDGSWEAYEEPERVTHGRHCPCSACAAQDWAEPQLAPCGMHGPSCPPVYAPIRREATTPPPGSD